MRAIFQSRFFGLLLVTLTLIVVAAAWIVGREQTLQWAVQKALISNDLKVSGVTGSLYSSIHVARISYHSPERTIVAKHATLRISPAALMRGRIVINDAKVALLTIDNLAASKKPLVLPSDLALSIPLNINNALFEKIIISTQGKHTAIDSMRFSLTADARDWRLKNMTAGTAWGKLNASLTLASKRPFALAGKASLEQGDAQSKHKIETQLQGTLSDIALSATANIQSAAGEASLRLMPFEQQILRAADIKLRGVNPASFRDGLPLADLHLALSARIAPDGILNGKISLVNNQTPQAPLTQSNQQRLPMRHVDIELAGKLDSLQMKSVGIDLGAAGKFTGEGSIQGNLVALTLHTKNLNLKAINERLHTTKIAGQIVLGVSAKTQTLHATLAEGGMRLDIDATLAAGLLQMRQARLRTGSSDVRLSGDLNLAGTQPFKASGNIAHFNPAQFGNYPRADLNADFRLHGQLASEWQIAADYTLRASRLLNQATSGRGKFTVDARHLRDVDIGLTLGGNTIAAQGNFGVTGDKLEWRVDAPRLQAIGPEFGGTLKGKGTLAGTQKVPQLSFSVDAHNLKLFERHRIQSLRSTGRLEEGERGHLTAEAALVGIESSGLKLQSFQVSASGTRESHSVRATARGDAIDTQAEVRGGWRATNKLGGWEGALAVLENKGRLAFSLDGPAPLRLSSAQIALNDATLKLPNGVIKLQSFEKMGPHLHTRGQMAGVPFEYLAQFSPGLSKTTRDNLDTDLQFGANWVLDIDQTVDGTLRIYREDGDITMRNELAVTLGLSRFEARADIVKNVVHAQFDMEGTRLGHAHLDGKVRLVQQHNGWALPSDSPLAFSGNARMSSIAWLAILSRQPGLDFDGKLALDFSADGTVGTPKFKGQLSGDQLTVSLANEGLKLRNGQLRAQLNDDQLILDQLRFDGKEGNVTAGGWFRYTQAAASMEIKLAADKLQILSRPDRLLTVSGQSSLTLDKKRLQFDGKFRAERALIELANEDAPVMSNDVVILGAPPKQAKPITSVPFYMDLELDLGERFFLKGKGLDAQLAGLVRLTSADSRMPRATGSIRVVKGTYAAYGQRLQIERGVLTFTGPLDNPGINILALRKKINSDAQDGSVEVGVEVRGTALAPSAKLVSTPSVPDSEKLSWLVLGHGMGSATGKEFDLLGVAASALFGATQSASLQARMATSLGIDEVGLTQARGLESTVLTIGKRISSKAYLTYEQGAGRASTLVKLRYALSPRLSLQGQSGTNNALDLLYTWSFD